MIGAPQGPPSLRREIVLWYSVVLMVALGGFTIVTYLLLQQALERTGTASLRQAAQYTEEINIPPACHARSSPRLRVAYSSTMAGRSTCCSGGSGWRRARW